MKKILLFLCFFLLTFSSYSLIYADGEENGTIKVKTSEKIPGLDCSD
jgi:hypothetical protein